MVSKALFSSNSDEWATPQHLFNIVNSCYNFTIDAAATDSNTKCDRRMIDGLSFDWNQKETVWCNPPYSSIKEWIKKASESEAKALLLIPVRTDTRYWHDYIFPRASFIVFIKGRLKFGDAKNSAPFPSALIGFNILEKPLLKTLGKVVSLR